MSTPNQPDLRIAFCQCGGSWDTTVGLHPCPACLLKERAKAKNVADWGKELARCLAAETELEGDICIHSQRPAKECPCAAHTAIRGFFGAAPP